MDAGATQVLTISSSYECSFFFNEFIVHRVRTGLWMSLKNLYYVLEMFESFWKSFTVFGTKFFWIEIVFEIGKVISLAMEILKIINFLNVLEISHRAHWREFHRPSFMFHIYCTRKCPKIDRYKKWRLCVWRHLGLWSVGWASGKLTKILDNQSAK